MTGHLYSEELINNLLNLNIPLNKVQNRDRIENLYASIYRSLHEKEINSKKVYDSCKELLSILNLKESEIKLTKIYEIILKLK